MHTVDRLSHLLRPFDTSEAVTQRDADGVARPMRHVVTHLPLLDQIEHTVTGSQRGGEAYHAAYGSKPAGRLDCLAYLQRVERQSVELCAELGLPTPGTTRDRLRRIAAVALAIPHNKVVLGWWAAARVLTQHDGPPMAPNVVCPDCDQRGALRVRFDPNVGLCTACGATWAEDDFADFAVWVRWAAEHLAGPEHRVPVAGYTPELGYTETCRDCAEERLARARRTLARLHSARLVSR